ncbi:hypothetical protein [Clostridium sp. DL1XJH146]
MSKKSKSNILSEKTKDELGKVNLEEQQKSSLQDKKKDLGHGNPINLKR